MSTSFVTLEMGSEQYTPKMNSSFLLHYNAPAHQAGFV